MTAIVLQGKANAGKTQTLNKLIDMISEKCSLDIKKVNKDEHWAIGEYNNLTIAVSTQGDSADDLQKWINFIDSKNMKVDIYICPCRTRGSSLDFVWNYFGNENIIYHGKWYVTQANKEKLFEKLQDEINECQAKKIFEILNSL